MINVQNIKRTYGKGHGKTEALKNCSFSIRKGEFVAIVGKSGSGKSTLLRILGTIDRPDQVYGTGEKPVVEIEHKDVLKLGDAELSAFRRRRIGFIFQDYNLFPEFTAAENIILPLHLDKKEADKQRLKVLMESLGIYECRDKFPQEMSGGEQQRTAVARALIHEPALVLADEPTGNLDMENALEVAVLLKKAVQNYKQTIVMVTHDRQMAEYADRIISIEDGVVRI